LPRYYDTAYNTKSLVLSPIILSYLLLSTQSSSSHSPRYYDTAYNTKSLVAETNTWKSIKATQFPELTYPAPNLLIPEKFELLGGSLEAKKKMGESEKKVRRREK
jgi:secreted Zn-dependent insulinase-like peptidase